jgi:hypothetical protein
MHDLTSIQQVILKRSSNQLFAVVTWGCAATTWLAKALNSHPEILCLHAGTNAFNTFHQPVEDSFQYFRVLSHLGHGYAAVGDVHGLARWEIPKLKEAFGPRFNASIVVREPIARIRSQMALYEEFQGLNAWNLSYVEKLIESKNILADSEEAKMFVHAANMLNTITEEVAFGTIYRAEELTSNPDCLRSLVGEITGGKVDIREHWLEACIGSKKVNAHANRATQTALTDWQTEVVRAVVRPEAWSIYEDLGYVTPEFVVSSASRSFKGSV